MVNIPKREKSKKLIDKSDYFASITCLNGMINGSVGPQLLEPCKDTLKYKEYP